VPPFVRCFFFSFVSQIRSLRIPALTPVINSFERKIDDESLGKRPFEALSISQLTDAIMASRVQAEVADTDSSVLRLLPFRGEASLQVFRIAQEQYVLIQVTSSSIYDEGQDYLRRNTLS
jgi:hypothetical protein